MTPRYPGWRPFVAGYPTPPLTGDPNPTPVVIRRPTKMLVGIPEPTAIGPNPVTVSIRSPIALGNMGFKAIPVITCFDPIAV